MSVDRWLEVEDDGVFLVEEEFWDGPDFPYYEVLGRETAQVYPLAIGRPRTTQSGSTWVEYAFAPDGDSAGTLGIKGDDAAKLRRLYPTLDESRELKPQRIVWRQIPRELSQPYPRPPSRPNRAGGPAT